MSNIPPLVLLSRLKHELTSAQIHDEGQSASLSLALRRAQELADQLKESIR